MSSLSLSGGTHFEGIVTGPGDSSFGGDNGLTRNFFGIGGGDTLMGFGFPTGVGLKGKGSSSGKVSRSELESTVVFGEGFLRPENPALIRVSSLHAFD